MPTRTRTRLLLALLALALPVGAAQAAPKDKHAKARSFTYTLPGARTFPEGIAIDRAQKRFYVSSITDGSILRGSLRGGSASVFLPGGADGRTTAVGVKTDRRNRLYVAGGATGAVFVYDLRTKALIRKFQTAAPGTNEATFINDLTIARNGDVYVTDSPRPFLYRIPASQVDAGRGDTVPLAPFVTYEQGFQAGQFNANGIQAIDRDTLIYVDSGDGVLYRVTLRDKTITPVDLGGAKVTNGDGLALQGRSLYVVRNAAGVVAKIKLAKDERSGRVVSQTSDPTFRYPTTAALVKGRLLAVNAQFDKRTAMTPPELPFSVSSIRRP